MRILRTPKEMSTAEKKYMEADFTETNTGSVHTGLPWGVIFDRLGWPEYFGLRLEKSADGKITIYEKDEETGSEKSQTVPEAYTRFCMENYNLDSAGESAWGYRNPVNAGAALFPDITAWYMLGYDPGIYVFWLEKDGETMLYHVIHDGSGARGAPLLREDIFFEVLRFAKKRGIPVNNETVFTVRWGSVHEDETPGRYIDFESTRRPTDMKGFQIRREWED